MTKPINAFGDAMQDVVERMLGESASWQPVASVCAAPVSWAVVSMMKIGGDTHGWIRLRAAEETAQGIIQLALGFSECVLSRSEMGDGVAELLNIIAGGAKARLSGTPNHFQLGTLDTRWIDDGNEAADEKLEGTRLFIDLTCGRLDLSFHLEARS